MYRRFIYEAGAPGGGGGLPPALKDMQPQPGSQTFPRSTPIPGVDPNEPIKAADPKPADITDKDKLPIPPVDPKEPAPEGKKYNDKGEIVDDPDFKPADPVDPKADEDDSTYWADVEKHTGIPVEVEYPVGMDVLSPEGVAFREKAVRAQERNTFEQNLKNKYPHGYAFLLHHMAGGNDNDFFKPERGISLPELSTLEGSVDAQSAFVKADLIARGIEPEVADAQIAADIKNNKLKGKATALHNHKTTERTNELREIENSNAADNKRAEAAISSMIQRIDKTMPDLGFVIPDADKGKLSEYFQDNLIYDRQNQTFFLNREIKADELKSVLEGLTFLYYGGNLDKVIQKKAATVASQRLRRQADKSKTPLPNGQEPGKSSDTFVSFGQMGPKK